MPGSCPGEVLVQIGSYIYPIDLSDDCCLDLPNIWTQHSTTSRTGSSVETSSSDCLTYPTTPDKCPLESTTSYSQAGGFRQDPNVPQTKAKGPTAQKTSCQFTKDNDNITECKAFVTGNSNVKEEYKTEGHIVKNGNNKVCEPTLADLISSIETYGENVTSSTVGFYEAVCTDGQGVANSTNNYIFSDCSREFRENTVLPAYLDHGRSIWKIKNLENKTLCQFDQDFTLKVKKTDREDAREIFPVRNDCNDNRGGITHLDDIPPSECLTYPTTPEKYHLEGTASYSQAVELRQDPHVQRSKANDPSAPMTPCQFTKDNDNITERNAFVTGISSVKEEYKTEGHILKNGNNKVCEPTLADLISSIETYGENVTSSTVGFYEAVCTDGQGEANSTNNYIFSDCSREFRENTVLPAYLDHDRSIWKIKNLENKTLCQFDQDFTLKVKKTDKEDARKIFPVKNDCNDNRGGITHLDENGNPVCYEFGLYPQLEKVQTTDAMNLQSSTNTRQNKKSMDESIDSIGKRDTMGMLYTFDSITIFSHIEQRGCKVWEFVRDLLLDPATNPSLIRWENKEEGTFRLIEPKTISHMWGMKRGNEDMNYDKLSRAMRYHYKRGILSPVKGRNLIYGFGPNATGWK